MYSTVIGILFTALPRAEIQWNLPQGASWLVYPKLVWKYVNNHKAEATLLLCVMPVSSIIEI
jgi:hypothetical protein